MCIGQRKNLRHWRNIAHERRSEEHPKFSDQCDQLEIFPNYLPDSNINEEENNNSLLEKQLDIFQDESLSDQFHFFPTEEEAISCTSAKVVDDKCPVICLQSARRRNTSILESSTVSNVKERTQFNAIKTDQQSRKISSLQLQRMKMKKRRFIETVNKIMNRQMIGQLVRKLDRHKLTKDFVFSLQAMARGDIPVNNIPHLAHLETMRFHRCRDSRRMWYSNKMKKFWHCFYKVGGGPPLRLLSGPKGIGINNYEPSACRINFAVPSTNTIRNFDKSDSPKIISPSIFNPIIEKIAETISNTPKEFILSYDGKSVGTGLKGDNCGDVDLWGFESEPNLKEAEDRVKEENIIIENFNRKFREENYSDSKEPIQEIVTIMTSRIRDIRKIIDKCKKTEIKYTKADIENPKYKDKHQYTIQGAQYLADNCRAIIRRALNVNRELCEILSYINETHELYNTTGIVHFHEQPNLKILMDPEEVSDFLEENDNTIYVKQRTEIWAKIREMCSVTGSTMHKALGLNTLQDQKLHYDIKFRGKEQPAPTEEVKKMLNYGTENEVTIHFINLQIFVFLEICY